MKEIPLTQGKVALVDDEDYARLNDRAWHATKCNRNGLGVWYARHTIALRNLRMVQEPRHRKYKTLQLHREVLNVTDPNLVVDHRDGNPLNNCKSNLRICLRGQNSRNRRANTGRRFKGVSFYRPGRNWRAYIGHPAQHLGYFSTEDAAARAYDRKARELFGEFANLNFPDNLPQEKAA